MDNTFTSILGNYDLFLEEISNLQTEVATLKHQNSALKHELELEKMHSQFLLDWHSKISCHVVGIDL